MATLIVGAGSYDSGMTSSERPTPVFGSVPVPEGAYNPFAKWEIEPFDDPAVIAQAFEQIKQQARDRAAFRRERAARYPEEWGSRAS
jgi:hypothetical protein